MQDESESFSWAELIKSVWFLLGEKKNKFIFFTLILALVNFYTIVPPLLLGKIVELFVNYKPGNSLSLFVVYVLGLGLSYSVVSFIRLTVKQVLGNLRSDIVYNVKVLGFEKLIDYSLTWHDQENTGSKVKKIENGIDAYRGLSNMLNNTLLGAFATFVGVISVFLFLNAKYVIFFIIYVLIFFIILQFFYKRIQKANLEYNEATEKAGGSYIEGLSNILTIKTLGAGEDFKSHVAKKEDLSRQHEYQMRRLGISLWRTFQVFNGLCYSTFLLVVGLGVIGGQITVGSVVVFYGYLGSLIGSANQYLDIYESLISSKTSIGRMMPILRGKSDLISGDQSFPKSWDKITLNKVYFNYKDEDKGKTKTLSNINITIERRQKIGIVGKTGSGKSTLSKLLLGLYKIDSGSYKIGGLDFYGISRQDITKNIAIVLQDSEMFNLSLKENITLLRKIPSEVLYKAVKIAQLEKVVAKLPQGLDTLIGEKGYHLSGGERQRVGIARAICKNSQIIVFDEATSSLDSKTEQMIYSSLENELKDKTVLAIAHRISSLKNMDIIYVFKEGKIVEQGAFGYLSGKKDSEFSKVYSKQT